MDQHFVFKKFFVIEQGLEPVIFFIVTDIPEINKIIEQKLAFDMDSFVVFITVYTFFPLCACVSSFQRPICFPFMLE